MVGRDVKNTNLFYRGKLLLSWLFLTYYYYILFFNYRLSYDIQLVAAAAPLHGDFFSLVQKR